MHENTYKTGITDLFLHEARWYTPAYAWEIGIEAPATRTKQGIRRYAKQGKRGNTRKIVDKPQNGQHGQNNKMRIGERKYRDQVLKDQTRSLNVTRVGPNRTWDCHFLYIP
jgi:hypothetical protein